MGWIERRLAKWLPSGYAEWFMKEAEEWEYISMDEAYDWVCSNYGE